MDVRLKERAESILKEMTLDEKIGMIHGTALFQTLRVSRLGIPPLITSDGPMGVRLEFEPDSWKPLGNSDDYTTYLPCNSALAATWNRKLAFETGSVLGEEARGRGKDVILAPGINIKRSPLCGRNFEYFSEDPYLTKEMAVQYIKGVQKWDVAACVKHFAANNQETERNSVDVQIDEDVLREIYLSPFYAALKEGGAYAVMGAYNKIYGEHCCQSSYLLDKILREEWGYDGVVISDWGGVHNTKAAAQSSLDIEMSVYNNFDEYCMAEPLKKKIENGEIAQSAVDEKVLRILVMMMKLHMLDGERCPGSYNTPVHRQKALETARESVVLLKNDNNCLPLKKEKIHKILLVGENADKLHAYGGGSAELKALYEVSPYMGLKSHLGGNVKVLYAQGYCSKEKEAENENSWQETSLEAGGGATKKQEEADESLKAKRQKLLAEAVNLAKECDTVVYIGGLNHDFDCEGVDRADMKLPYEQDVLINALLDVKPDMVVVMMAGSQVEMGSWIDRAQAVVWHWYAGMEGGNALAEVLLGDVNPSGKMPDTMYKKHTDCSAHALGEFPGGKAVAYREGRFVGYRYNDKYNIKPQFPFGHGLSYTEFKYRDLTLDREKGIASCYIKNVGQRAGAEVVQIYRKEPETKNSVIKELAGFEKVFLEVGEEKEVTVKVEGLTLDSEIMAGASIEDIRIKVR